MRELDPKDMLLDDDNVVTSYKPVNRSSSSSNTGYYNTSRKAYGVAGPSNSKGSAYVVAGPSNPRGSAYGVAGASNHSSSYSEHSDQPRKRRSRSKSGESIDEAISLSSDNSSGKSKIKKKANKRSKRRHSRSPPNPPKYLFTLDMDKDLLTALRVNVDFSITFFMVLTY